MTPEQIQTALAEAIRDAIDNVHDMDVTHEDYARAGAAAVLALIGPRPLVWVWSDRTKAWRTDHTSGIYMIYEDDGQVWLDQTTSKRTPHTSIPVAQAAAQSHRDAAHWSGMVLADMIGGE